MANESFNMSNMTGNGTEEEWIPGSDLASYMFAIFDGIIFLGGTVGNVLVIFVVLRYTKMKTVTNMYILNLAVADLCFLVGLPFLITTLMMRNWVFGYYMCKIFYIMTSTNWFTSVFQLTVMSADRYLAVCHPIQSIRYRTPLVARIVCVIVWVSALVVMMPILLYAETVSQKPGHVSCTIRWPPGQAIHPDMAFIWYALLLGFAIPVSLIVVFYALIIIRLQSVGPVKKSKEKKKSHRKVTKMVLTVITVYVVCWLPYWVYQIVLTFAYELMPQWSMYVFQVITAISYANSMLNPLLYAFLSDNFRKAFIKAFICVPEAEVNGTLLHEHSTFPANRARGGVVTSPTSGKTHDEEVEFATTNVTSSTKVDSTMDGAKVSLTNNHSHSAEAGDEVEVAMV